LTMRRALRPTVPRTPPPIRRLRASLNPGGLRYRRALEGTPLVPRRCLPRARSAGRPLTSPVADELRSLRSAARRQSRSSAELRQELHLRATRDAFPRRVPARSPAPCEAMKSRTRARHRSPCFAAVDPASDALSPSRPARRGTARPRSLPCALHARALLATRRSSTSAIETICKHDLRTWKPGDASTSPRERFCLGTKLLDLRRVPRWRDRSSLDGITVALTRR
jgi:hypothetical protein